MEIRPRYSFVLPAYNEVGNVALMTERLLAVADRLGASVEILWVNDGSGDGTSDALDALSREHACLRVLHFSRNFGHMAALCAGLEAARATGAVITLDADGQHPPELIPEMIVLWEDGADIVQTIRGGEGEEGSLKRLSSKGFYGLFNMLCDTDIPSGAADFRLLDRQVVDALNNLPERVRFVRGLVHWVGFSKALLPYSSGIRMAGETKYGMVKMFSLAASGITSFSVRPLRLAFVLTLVMIAVIGVYTLYVLGALLGGKYLTPGWTSMMFIMLLLGAAQLLVIGIASEYLARVYVEQKQRPIYIVRKNDDTRSH